MINYSKWSVLLTPMFSLLCLPVAPAVTSSRLVTSQSCLVVLHAELPAVEDFSNISGFLIRGMPWKYLHMSGIPSVSRGCWWNITQQDKHLEDSTQIPKHHYITLYNLTPSEFLRFPQVTIANCDRVRLYPDLPPSLRACMISRSTWRMP